jgi:hypothetical protein
MRSIPLLTAAVVAALAFVGQIQPVSAQRDCRIKALNGDCVPQASVDRATTLSILTDQSKNSTVALPLPGTTIDQQKALRPQDTHENAHLQSTPGPFLYSCHPNC